MIHAVFTYGTLMSPRILHTLLSRVPPRQDATLPSFARFPIRGAVYPAVIRCESSAVRGKLLLDLTDAELALLDAYEDPAYERIVAPVQTEEGRTVQARVWARAEGNSDDLIAGTEWDFEKFVTEHEKWSVERCVVWAARYKEERFG